MYLLNKMEVYSYQELFKIINTQNEKENKNKKKEEPSYYQGLASSLFRTINNPTSQNLTNTLNISLNTNKKEIKTPDDISKYVYKHQ
jgi:predicted RND superfamily exporter protein